MKKLECIIRPEKLDDVRSALRKTGVGGMTVINARGFGKTRATGKGFTEKIRVDVYVDDFQADNIVQIIIKAAYTGNTGDGKIAVIPLKGIYRIRTGEKGVKAV